MDFASFMVNIGKVRVQYCLIPGFQAGETRTERELPLAQGHTVISATEWKFRPSVWFRPVFVSGFKDFKLGRLF